MKKTILWSALFAILSSQIQAEGTPAVSPQETNPTNNAIQQPAPTQNTTTETAPPTDILQSIPQTMAINCDYKISNTIKTLDKSIVQSWSEKATLQAFGFASSNIDNQIKSLQACFTDQGWVGFNNALQKSGNMDAIKSQHLTMNSTIDGQAQLTEIKDNQWKVSIPLQVVYQNEKEKVTQLLTVDLTIGRKNSGDLGIMQIIATPRPQSQQQNASDATPKTTDDKISFSDTDYDDETGDASHRENAETSLIDSDSQEFISPTAELNTND